MSKTITIPTNCNPYIVVINNHVYTYRAGETVEVPDEVAEAIADALELVPKPKRYLSKFVQRAEGSLAQITEADLEGIETIVNHSFNYCNKLTSVTIPKSVTSIGDGAFYTCTNLETVRFVGDKVNSIGKNAFQWCGKLKAVYLPETPPTISTVDTFGNADRTCVFYCKTQASKEAYLAAPNWSTLAETYSFVVEA